MGAKSSRVRTQCYLLLLVAMLACFSGIVFAVAPDNVVTTVAADASVDPSAVNVVTATTQPTDTTTAVAPTEMSNAKTSTETIVPHTDAATVNPVVKATDTPAASPYVTMTTNSPISTMYNNTDIYISVTGTEGRAWSMALSLSPDLPWAIYPDTYSGTGDSSFPISTSLYTPGVYAVTASLTVDGGGTASATLTLTRVRVTPNITTWDGGEYYLRAGTTTDIAVTIEPSSCAAQVDYGVSGAISLQKIPIGYRMTANEDAGVQYQSEGAQVCPEINGLPLAYHTIYLYDTRIGINGLPKAKKVNPGTAIMLHDVVPISLVVPYWGPFLATLSVPDAINVWADPDSTIPLLADGEQSIIWDTSNGQAQIPPTAAYVEGVQPCIGTQLTLTYTGGQWNPIISNGSMTDTVKIAVLESADFDNGAYTMAVGDSISVPLATTVPAGAGDALTYATADPSIAQVIDNNGTLQLKGLSGGSTLLTAYASGHAVCSATVNVVDVFTLAPSAGVEFDDGDKNSKTKSYAVPIAAEGTLTVTATPTPALDEADLPASWSLSGGEGTGKLSRTVDLTKSGSTTITCTCGTTTKSVTIHVVAVTDLTVTGATAFDDGSTDPNTTAYETGIADSGDVTITATYTPSSVPESALTSIASLTGGTGSGLITRTVSKTQAALTTITCTCGSSTKTAKIYVIKVNLQMQGLGEETGATPHELDPGAYIAWHGGDVATLSIEPGGVTAGTVSLVIDGSLKLWQDATKTTECPASWNLADGQLPATVYVEGVTPSSSACDSPLTLTYTSDTDSVSDTVNLTVLGVDLEVGGVSETDEQSVGAYVGVNDNDDNGNGVADMSETLDADGNVTVDNEANLIPASLIIPAGTDSGTVTLSGGNGKITVWTDSTKGHEIPLPATWTLGSDSTNPMPETVYLEGISASASVRDAGLSLTYSGHGVTLSDSAALTVVKATIGAAASGEDGIVLLVNRDDDNGNTTQDLDETTAVQGENELVPISISVAPANLDAGSLNLTLPGNMKGWTTGVKGTAATTSWAIPVKDDTGTPINFAPVTLYLEGTAASSAVGDGKLQLTYTHGGQSVYTQTVKSTVADLTIALNNDTLYVNNDDDDNDGASDLGQTGPITSENDLDQLRITLLPAGLHGTLSVSGRTRLYGDPDANGKRPIVGYGGSRVNFYLDACKGNGVPNNGNWTLDGTNANPDAVWVEGTALSTLPDDQEITVTYTNGGCSVAQSTTATINARPGNSEVHFKLYAENPIGGDKAKLNNEITGDIGNTVALVMEVKVGPGERLDSSTATVRIKDNWSGYEAGKTRAYLDVPVDFTAEGWSELTIQPNQLTWSNGTPYHADNSAGSVSRIFYKVIKDWNTGTEPYTEYKIPNTEDAWRHFEDPTVGHNGEHSINIVAVGGDTNKSALDFQHYDVNGTPAGWQTPTGVSAVERKPMVSNLCVTNLSPGNGTIDYVKYDPVPESKYHRPTMDATFVDKNLNVAGHTYEVYWMLLATANPAPREHLNMDDVYSRADAVVSKRNDNPTTVHFTWQGHVGILPADTEPTEGEMDQAEWGTYTYDVDVIERDASGGIVDWHSYKWPSCLSIGEHTLEAVGNETESAGVLDYTYTVHDIGNEDATGYYPNAEAPSDIKVIFVDNCLEEKVTAELDWEEYGITYCAEANIGSDTSFYDWRSIYVGQDNCWKADKRDHLPSRMLAVNKSSAVIYDYWEAFVEEKATAIAKGLKDSNWNAVRDGDYKPDDAGAFGKEVGKRVTKILTDVRTSDGSRFYSNVVINKITKEVQWWNLDPTEKAVPNTCKEIDLIRCKKGYELKTGKPIDSSQVYTAWEIRNSVDGRITRETKQFYRDVCPESRLCRVASGYRYKYGSGGFDISDEVRYATKNKIFQYASLVGVVPWAIKCSRMWLEDPSTTAEFKEVEACIGEVRADPNDGNAKIGLHVALMNLLNLYLDEQVVGVANYIGLERICRKW